ncbi:MAG: sigma-70 family RNA polymerase sigma factor, partial [Planctomycetota bacterium]|nr:sigma-70 family RNA polymerase sigma factor [Planctomycetota bacterium]
MPAVAQGKRPVPTVQPDAERDEDLLRRFVKHGDGDALGKVFARHVDTAYRVARRYFPHTGDAEDAVQSACLLVMRNAGQFRGGASVRAWFMGHVVNVCRNKVRENARRASRQRHASAPSGEPDAVRIAAEQETS